MTQTLLLSSSSSSSPFLLQMRRLCSFSSLSFLCSSSANPTKSITFFFSTFSTTNTPNPIITNHLISIFGFSPTQATPLSIRLSSSKNSNNLQTIIDSLKTFGLSDTHIGQTIRFTPQILFCNIEKILQPKLRFLQELGIKGSDLGQYISKNSVITSSLNKRLIPNVEILKNIVSDPQDLIKILNRCKWVLTQDPNSRLLPNISFLESRGIVGSQLVTLLKRKPTLVLMKEPKLKELVGRVEEIGFKSRMLVHGLYTLSSMNPDTLSKKFEVFKSFGFSQDECGAMLKREPGLLRTSMEKLRLGIEFYLNVVGFETSVLVSQPHCLMLSLEKRVIPRYRVLQILKSKKLFKMKKMPSFVCVLGLREDEFLDKFVSRFVEDAEELLIAYKYVDLLVDSPEEL